jgi:hypothetical protein
LKLCREFIYQVYHHLASLETRPCLVQVQIPLDSAHRDGINVDYSGGTVFDLIASIPTFASVKSGGGGIAGEKGFEGWIRDATVNGMFVPIDVNLLRIFFYIDSSPEGKRKFACT